MILLLITIPLMVLGVAIATVPVLIAMVHEERLCRAERATVRRLEGTDRSKVPLAA